MGYHIAVDDPAGRSQSGRKATKVGGYGSQTIMMALWLAAYAVAGRAESKRVCGALEPISGPEARKVIEKIAASCNRSSFSYYNLRNRPRLVYELLCANDEDSAWITLFHTDSAGYTFDRGRQLKPFTDPWLEALAELFDVVTAEDPAQSLDAASVGRIAPVLSGLVGHLQVSCWHENMVQVAEVFQTAATHGVGVRLG